MLPNHGWIGCTRCYEAGASPRLIGDDPRPSWRIEGPNGAWGASEPLVVVLGFSRGARQSKPLPFDDRPFHGMRGALTKIMQSLGLLSESDHIGKHINANERDFHFASLFRCSISMFDPRKNEYSKSGGGILVRFLEAAETREVAHNCTEQFLKGLPPRTRLVLLLGNSDKYVKGCRSLVQRLYPDVRPLNSVAYGNGQVTWVHCIHAAAQGRHVPEFVAGADTAIGRKLLPAQEAVATSGVIPLLQAGS